MRSRWPAAAALAGAVSVAHAEPAPATLDLSYDAPAGCPDRRAFAARLRAGSPSAPRPPADFALEVHIERSGERFAGRLLERAPDGTGRVRDVTGATCGEVADALGFLVALLLGLEPPPRAPPPPPPPPRPSQASRRDDDPWQLGGGLEARNVPLLGPTLRIAPAPYLEWLHGGNGPFRPTLRLSGINASSAIVAAGDGRARLRRATARLDFCILHLPLLKNAVARACASFDAGVMTGRGTGEIDDPTQSRRPWLTPGALLRGEWSVLGPVVVSADAGAWAPLQRQRYYFGPESTLYRVPSVGGGASLGAGIRWP